MGHSLKSIDSNDNKSSVKIKTLQRTSINIERVRKCEGSLKVRTRWQSFSYLRARGAYARGLSVPVQIMGASRGTCGWPYRYAREALCTMCTCYTMAGMLAAYGKSRLLRYTHRRRNSLSLSLALSVVDTLKDYIFLAFYIRRRQQSVQCATKTPSREIVEDLYYRLLFCSEQVV